MTQKTHINNSQETLWRRVVDLYVDGFRSMRVGKTLWLIIIIKLFIMFAILKFFFFPNFLNSQFESDTERSEYVGGELIERIK